MSLILLWCKFGIWADWILFQNYISTSCYKFKLTFQYEGHVHQRANPKMQKDKLFSKSGLVNYHNIMDSNNLIDCSALQRTWLLKYQTFHKNSNFGRQCTMIAKKSAYTANLISSLLNWNGRLVFNFLVLCSSLIILTKDACIVCSYAYKKGNGTSFNCSSSTTVHVAFDKFIPVSY